MQYLLSEEEFDNLVTKVEAYDALLATRDEVIGRLDVALDSIQRGDFDTLTENIEALMNLVKAF